MTFPELISMVKVSAYLGRELTCEYKDTWSHLLEFFDGMCFKNFMDDGEMFIMFYKGNDYIASLYPVDGHLVISPHYYPKDDDSVEFMRSFICYYLDMDIMKVTDCAYYWVENMEYFLSKYYSPVS